MIRAWIRDSLDEYVEYDGLEEYEEEIEEWYDEELEEEIRLYKKRGETQWKMLLNLT